MKTLQMTAAVLLLFSSLAWATDARVKIPLADSPGMGPPDAPVTIVEFIDFQ